MSLSPTAPPMSLSPTAPPSPLLTSLKHLAKQNCPSDNAVTELNGASKSSWRCNSLISNLSLSHIKEKISDAIVIFPPYYTTLHSVQMGRHCRCYQYVQPTNPCPHKWQNRTAVVVNDATMPTFPKREYHGTSSVHATARYHCAIPKYWFTIEEVTRIVVGGAGNDCQLGSGSIELHHQLGSC